LIEQQYLDESVFQLRKLKAQADKAMAQVDDGQFFELLDADANSIALIVKHVAGNMRSRWTDFLSSDGEKPDRHRDSEFERESADTRDAILGRWEAGWDVLFSALMSLGPGDLGKTVTIRNEPHSVVQAINRQVSHYSAHVGQIVLLAKHFAGANWKTLSIPRRGKG
jgi:hypothetical protein